MAGSGEAGFLVPATHGYPGYTLANALRGALIYGGGDTFAAWILGELTVPRMLGMAALGGSLYALEVPNWFHWIDLRVPTQPGWGTSLIRTALALVYFNPLWIARHLCFIALFSGTDLGAGLLIAGTRAFVVNIPVALLANYLIQNALSPRHRFTASALYSAGMAIYYALSVRLFG